MIFEFTLLHLEIWAVFKKSILKYALYTILSTKPTIATSIVLTEAVPQWCSVKRCSYKFRKIHGKTTVSESIFK